MLSKKEIEEKATEIVSNDKYAYIRNECYEAIMQMVDWLMEKRKPNESKYEYIVGKKPKFSVGDILEHCYEDNYSKDIFFLGKIIKVEFDNEKQDWKYTFADKCDGDGETEEYEQDIILKSIYKISQERYETYWLHFNENV